MVSEIILNILKTIATVAKKINKFFKIRAFVYSYASYKHQAVTSLEFRDLLKKFSF